MVIKIIYLPTFIVNLKNNGSEDTFTGLGYNTVLFNIKI